MTSAAAPARHAQDLSIEFQSFLVGSLADPNADVVTKSPQGRVCGDRKAGAKLAEHRGSQREGNIAMRREQLTEKILDIKRARNWTWRHVCQEIGGVSEVMIVGALLGQMKLVKPLAAKAAALFGLDESEQRMLNEIPHRGSPMPPTDPLIYRFYELVMVNGPAWKALIEEEFGDCIMSAIDFDMKISREPNPRGDRVRFSMSGKFLPFKYYGAEQGLPEYGYRED